MVTREDAMEYINSRKQITSAGKYRVKVTTCNELSTPIDRGNGNIQTHIANFNAMTNYQLQQALAVFQSLEEGDDHQEATNFALSSSIRYGKDYLPVKGETVDILVSEVENKDGINILVVNGIYPLPLQQGKKIDIASLLAKSTSSVSEEGDLGGE